MTIRLVHPLPGSTPTGVFGWRDAFTENGIWIPSMFHNGQDYAAPLGAPIRAAHDGTILWSGWDVIGGGWGVQILHHDGHSTLYLHMRERSVDVTIGQTVKAGQTIGRVGMTGTATGPHLHFMLRIGGADVDPVPYLSAVPAPIPTPLPRAKHHVRALRKRSAMIYIFDKDSKSDKGGRRWAVFTLGQKGSWWEFRGEVAGPMLEKQLGPAMGVSAATFEGRKKLHQ